MSKALMKIIFYLGIASLLFGAFNYSYYKHSIYTAFFFLFGYICLSLLYLTKTIGDCIKKDIQPLNIALQILCIPMSIVLFFKYYPLPSLDYFSLFVVPFFIITSAIYLAKDRKRYIELTLTVIVYLYLSLPLFGIMYREKERLISPRHYIPVEWYKSTYFSLSLQLKITPSFETKKTEKLYQEAVNLMDGGKYEDAIEIFSEIIAIEPNNAKALFDFANCYGATDNFNEAIPILDQAIATNDSLPYLFNNRGQMYYRLAQNTNAIADFQKAIALDSSLYIPYINMALVYCYTDKYQEAWETIQKAEKLGGGEMLDNMSPDIRTIAQRWK